ncbi:MAG: FtsQ-type POTRA domain-containing protein [Acidobacteriota bacterium]|nr:FtsQ-type POTRA domain-containing protein [Acidobacteriota bacterium]
MYHPAFHARILLALVALATVPLFPPPAAAQTSAGSPAPAARADSDLDRFMEKVLARRDVNRVTFNQYVLDETESFEILGPGRQPLHRRNRDFTWYARDDMHVRSPVRFDGVSVGESDRRTYEQDWIGRERGRRERRARKEKEKGEVSGPAAVEPRFVSEAYFMDFKFEPGNYYLAGREKLEGQDVLRIEYYPTRLFNDSDDEKRPREMRKDRPGREEQDIDRRMNKTALVTLWVDPTEHQIVKYTFDNVWLDFLPGAWLVRIDDLRASMTMGQPLEGVWLPRTMNIHAGLTLAAGSFEASYERLFSNYREAEVKTKITVPKEEAAHGAGVPGCQGCQGCQDARGAMGARGPQVPQVLAASRERGMLTLAAFAVQVEEGRSRAAGPAVETVREIRVHGNAFLTDDEVLKLAGVAVGDPLRPSLEQEIAQRLKDSRRFESVDVRKRYRSLDDPTDVALVLVVHERAGTTADASGTSGPPSPWRRFRSRVLFLPIVGYADGYGLTYGGRVSTMDLLTAGERLSVPLTWGATKRAALEFERTFRAGPLTRVFSSAGISSRRNPHFQIDDRRLALRGRAERQFARLFRTGVDATRSAVTFGTADGTLWSVGADAALDTRADPAFPGNAAVLGGGWTRLNVRGLPAINRYTADARGYARIIGQNVIAGRLQYFTSDAALPAYERLLLGGAPTLRGFRGGAFSGDRMVITSGELRAPLTSVLRSARLGLTVFMDAAKVVDVGASLAAAAWHRGAGAGLFLLAPLIRINVDVAHGFDSGTRLNIGTGFSF